MEKLNINKQIQEKLKKIDEELKDLINFERQRRQNGYVPKHLEVECGICLDKVLDAILYKYANGDGVRCDGFFGTQYPTKIVGPDNEKLWLIFLDFGAIQITTNPIISPEEYEKNLQDYRYVMPLK